MNGNPNWSAKADGKDAPEVTTKDAPEVASDTNAGRTDVTREEFDALSAHVSELRSVVFGRHAKR